jgi:hypothetical protein
MSPARRPHLELVTIEGDATEVEKQVVHAALEKMVEEERQAKTTSLWLRAARSQGRRLGMLDYRDRFSHEDAWRLSARMPYGGREYPGLNGRGDAK